MKITFDQRGTEAEIEYIQQKGIRLQSRYTSVILIYSYTAAAATAAVLVYTI